MKKGFTLVELSIVLVIIGLLIGGILVGQSLVESAKIGRFIKEIQYYEVASKTFYRQYKYWPGDMPNAYSFFCPTCGTNNDHYLTGCNGNGDGSLGSANFKESSMFWTNLSLSTMLGDERYVRGFVHYNHNQIKGVTVPKFVSFPEISCLPMHAYTYVGAFVPNSPKSNGIYCGACLAGDCSQTPYFPTRSAMMLDAKLDDGNPSIGIFRSFVASIDYGTHCSTHGNPALARYLPEDKRGCKIAIINLNEDYPIIN